MSVAVSPALPLVFDLAAGPLSNKRLRTRVLRSTTALRLIMDTTVTGRTGVGAEEVGVDEAFVETLTL
jgi:hypothetical protein